jgi:UDPglucose 6-dehydrogenase
MHSVNLAEVTLPEKDYSKLIAPYKDSLGGTSVLPSQSTLTNIAIVGSGYVGLVTGACFAEVGHHVICVDNDRRKVAALQSGQIPIYEPGLQEVIHRNVSSHRLRFTHDIRDGVDNSQIIFIAVPTPPQSDGSVDLTCIEQVAREIAEVLTEYRVIVDKSTVPVKTGEKVAETIRRYNKVAADFDVVSNPEFLREGSAVAARRLRRS